MSVASGANALLPQLLEAMDLASAQTGSVGWLGAAFSEGFKGFRGCWGYLGLFWTTGTLGWIGGFAVVPFWLFPEPWRVPVTAQLAADLHQSVPQNPARHLGASPNRRLLNECFPLDSPLNYH